MTTLQRYRANRADAEDLAQAAWLRGWERLGQLRDPERVVEWVITIALNLLRDEFSRSRRMTEFPSAGADSGISHLPDVALIDLRRRIGNIPERQKTAIRRVYLCEESAAQVAAELRISEGALYHLLSRGRRSIRNAMNGA